MYSVRVFVSYTQQKQEHTATKKNINRDSASLNYDGIGRQFGGKCSPAGFANCKLANKKIGRRGEELET